MNPETKADGRATSDITPDTIDAQCLTGLRLYGVLSGPMVATTLISLDASIIALITLPAQRSLFNGLLSGR